MNRLSKSSIKGRSRNNNRNFSLCARIAEIKRHFNSKVDIAKGTTTSKEEDDPFQRQPDLTAQNNPPSISSLTAVDKRYYLLRATVR
jgi:hypothetical protein